jgi:molecular chaperone HscB
VASLQSNDFELFGIPMQFAQDRNVLDQRWKELQREAHPDRFAVQGAAAQRVAMQWSVRINEAYLRLKDPLRRAAYLCELHGVPVNAENNTAMPAAFLMQQMEWREALEDATGPADLEELADQVAKARRAALQQCEHLIDGARDYVQAVAKVRALMFIERFASEVEAKLDAQVDGSDSGMGTADKGQ